MNTDDSSQSVSEIPALLKPKIKRNRKPLVLTDPFNPKITRSLKKKIDRATANIDGIVRHVQNVQDNCILLGKKLIEQGHIDLGANLIRNGFLHDSSKFIGIEWENMAPGVPVQENAAKLKLKMAIHHHNSTNLHHPEAWTMGIKRMPLLYLCECICDWKSRSEEFGTDLRYWIDNSATKRWGFDKSDDVYKKIMEYVDILCLSPFENLPK